MGIPKSNTNSLVFGVTPQLWEGSPNDPLPDPTILLKYVDLNTIVLDVFVCVCVCVCICYLVYTKF